MAALLHSLVISEHDLRLSGLVQAILNRNGAHGTEMELTIDQALQRGIAAHREGKLQDAERLYRAILQAQPKHPDANHNLGLLAVAVGKPLEAIPLFKQALEANPQIDQFWLSYVDALLKLKRFDEAKRVVVEGEKSGVPSEKLEFLRQQIRTSPSEDKKNTKQGLTVPEKQKKLAEKKKRKAQGGSSGAAPSQDQLNHLLEHYQAGRFEEAPALATSLTQQFPKHPFGWKALGAVFKQTGRLEESLAPMQTTVKLSPQDAEAHSNLGVTLRALGRLDEAEASLRQATALKPDLAEAHCNLGNTLKELGGLDEAEASYKQAIALKPDLAEAHSNLGNTLRELGRLDEAEANLRQATALKPDYAEAHSNLGETLREKGTLEEAEASLRQALVHKPDLSKAHHYLGNTLKELGRLDEAEASYRQATALKPDYAKAHSNLGVNLKALGRLDEAEASLRQATALMPELAEAHYNLGVTLKELGRLDEAEASYRQATALKPDLAEAHSNLGNTLKELGRLDEAEASYRQATAVKPDYAEARSNLGVTLRELGRLDEAEVSLRQAIALKPDLAETHSNLGNTLKELGRLDEAEASCRQAIALKPYLAEAHSNLGNTLKDLCKLDEAEASYKRAIELKPDYAAARHNLLFSLNYDHRLSGSDLYKEYRSFGAWAQAQISKQFDHSNRSIGNKLRIRIGYSSPDFRGHACRFFMEPLFRNHDHKQFELFAYSNTAKEDAHTERMKQYFDHWIDVVRLSDEEMAKRIYEDQIDILVDMAGHTNGNRLLVFAMRPAPVQVSSNIGYCYTSGLAEIDYFLGDENLTPPGSEDFFSEQIYRLPAPSYAYEPPRAETPDVCDLPALRKGYVTFGSLTRTVRLNDPLLRVWGEVLDRIPKSRLRLDQKCFESQGVRELFWQRLEGLGVPRDRVDLACSEPHWLGFQEIDITLDTWPHNSGTTTLESLWMGVPVLSKTDRASVGCVGAAALKPLGLEDWLVETLEAYVEKAVSAASNLDTLARLRADLRSRVDQGPHLDAAAFTGHLESAYRQMIRGASGG